MESVFTSEVLLQVHALNVMHNTNSKTQKILVIFFISVSFIFPDFYRLSFDLNTYKIQKIEEKLT